MNDELTKALRGKRAANRAAADRLRASLTESEMLDALSIIATHGPEEARERLGATIVDHVTHVCVGIVWVDAQCSADDREREAQDMAPLDD